MSTLSALGTSARAQELPPGAFTAQVQSYLRTYCLDCHNAKQAHGELDLSRYQTARDVTADFRQWEHIVEFIRNGEMPPEDATQPAIPESNQVTAAIESILLTEARKDANDPGVILPRRLSNTEYDLSVRDLTGVDIRPTRTFPADPAGGEGFDNTGEALRMSPNLLKKYLSAAQHVADHLVLKPDGIVFAPEPVTSYNERKKFTEDAIIEFYERHSVDIPQYLEAAWRFRNRTPRAQRRPLEQDLRAWANERGLSAEYLMRVWHYLTGPAADSGFTSELQRRWNALSAADGPAHPDALKALVEFIDFGRSVLFAPTPSLIRSNAGNWPISHLDFRERIAEARDRFDPELLSSSTLLRVLRVSAPRSNTSQENAGSESLSVFIRIDPAFSETGAHVVIRRPVFSESDNLPRNAEDRDRHKVETLRSVLERYQPDLVERLGFGAHPAGSHIEADSFVVQAPAVIEIPLSDELRAALEGRMLLVPCELDPHSVESCVLVQSSSGEPPADPFSTQAKLLVFPESPAARQLTVAAEEFCRVFPNAFYYVDDQRGLAAGFHLVEGFFRDDRPLVEKVLSDEENRRLDQLWTELDFVTQRTETLLRGFVWFERSEREVLHDERFDFLRAEDPQLVEEAMLRRFETLYLQRLGIPRPDDSDGNPPRASADPRYTMVHGFFEDIRRGLKVQTQTLQTAEQRALADLLALARRAYRRPLQSHETESLRELYHALRSDGVDVEAALRGAFISLLMSPEFCYRYFTVPEGRGLVPLNDHDLASRLSYFLWSSLPDEELLAAADAGRLQNEEELVAHTRRMLRDPRIAAFSREFFGQWLRYRDFLTRDPINAEAFPEYDEVLRTAMFEEPVRLATWLIQTDQPVTLLLDSDVTFVNRTLAEHYGGDIGKQFETQAHDAAARSAGGARDAAGSDSDPVWCQVSGLTAQGRGGLPGMAVVLTKNSAGERTSPVKRGFWVVHHLLGQHFPPPPADVPELPTSETTAARSIRELLSAHVADTRCAMCHKHFDSLGLVMEGFDPIGRARSRDRAGRPVDSRSVLPNGETAGGIPELIEYIVEERRDEFLQTLCRKFLGYALGRSVMLSDQPLLDEMQAALAGQGDRFSALFETVVRSPQFRRQRARDFVKSR